MRFDYAFLTFSQTSTPMNERRRTTTYSVRPKIAELQFCVFGRSLHPELYESFESRRVERSRYQATLDITSSGHVVQWTADKLSLTEVTTVATSPLPEQRCLFRRRFHGKREFDLDWRRGIRYHSTFQMETVDQETIWMFQDAVSEESRRDGIVHIFQSSGRVELGAMSLISVESRERSLQVQSLHTFPDDSAIVRVVSVFELPPS
jgi:Protein of unknown function DUF2617